MGHRPAIEIEDRGEVSMPGKPPTSMGPAVTPAPPPVQPVETQTVLNARHLAAHAAGSIANVAASIARSLAWQPKPDQRSAFVADLERAREELRRADLALAEAIVRVRIAQAGE